MHFAAFIEVGESVEHPDKYYQNNFVNTLALLNTMRKNDINQIILSSTAATFGEPEYIPADEKHPQKPLNAYGMSKLMCEYALKDFDSAYGIKSVCLRYFNAAGADPLLRTGFRKNDPSHLIPIVLKVASGENPAIKINGIDYDTKDGTCVRDYIHVMDLCDAHLLAMNYLLNGGETRSFNLGNGYGYSVREVIDAVEKVTEKKLTVIEGPRRAGDSAALVADSNAIQHALGWKPQYPALETIVQHAWEWERLSVDDIINSEATTTPFLGKSGCTYLCVGPMSKNCVDACIELVNQYQIPIMLIASRRQIECAELGGGYVNNWDTKSFAHYVKTRDKNNLIILARDHGGPWQNPIEIEKYENVDDAMESAKLSYLRDIEAGFQYLHIDPVINMQDVVPSLDWILDKIFKLYEFCINKARELGKNISIEIGTEEQQQNPLKDIEQLEYVIQKIKIFCDEKGYQYPTFLVIQTGTKVMETRNIGKFPKSTDEIKNYLDESKIMDLINLCEKHGLKVKEHNGDYLSDTSLKVHPKIGIHAVNVAPEFGVDETRKFIEILEKNKMSDELEEFISIAHDSMKWSKWVIDPNALSRKEKAEICGHYVFSTNLFLDLKKRCEAKLICKGIFLEFELKEAVKKSIYRYLKCFNLIEAHCFDDV